MVISLVKLLSGNEIMRSFYCKRLFLSMSSYLIIVLVCQCLCVCQPIDTQGPPGSSDYGGNVISIRSIYCTNKIVAATAQGIFILDNNGWHRTAMDLRGTWALMTAMNSSAQDSIVIATLNYADFEGELFRNSDGGSKWFRTPVDSEPQTPFISAIQFDPIDSARVYAICPPELLISDNKGLTWQVLFLDYNFTCTDIVISFIDNKILFGMDGNGRIEQSTDRGHSWTQERDSAGSGYSVLKIDPQNTDILYLGGPDLFKSTNGGHYWFQTSFHHKVTDIAFDPFTDEIFLCADSQGVWRSDDSGHTFSKMPGLDTSRASCLFFSIRDQRKNLFVGTGGPTYGDATGDGVFYYDLGPIDVGWRLISLRVNAPDKRKNVLFPTALSSCYAHHDGYIQKDTLKFGTGYWLKFDDLGYLGYYPGDPVLQDTIDVAGGWNIIGGISIPVDTADIESEPPGIIQSHYFGYNGSYLATNSIMPSRGYWVKTSQAGKLIISNTILRLNGKK